jgi:predicted O-methyltransferase YrrM
MIFRRALRMFTYLSAERPYYIEPRGSATYRRQQGGEYASFLAEAAAKEHELHPAPNMDYTGASAGDYFLLYRYILNTRPSSVLEFGTGITTCVMARALAEVEQNNGGERKLVTVDHVAAYSAGTSKLLSPALAKYVEFHVSPMTGEVYQGISSIRYQDVPGDGYDFIFVDGPPAIIGRAQFPTTDALYHLKQEGAEGTTILVDRRLPTLSYYSLWLDKDVYFDPCLGVGLIKNVFARDVKSRPRSWGRRRVIVGNILKILNIQAVPAC